MDLDDLKAEWAKRDQALRQSLQTQTKLSRALLMETQMQKLRSSNGMNAFELIIYIAFIMFFGATAASSWGHWTVFVPTVLLDIWTIAMGALTFAERARLRQVDFSAPVLDIQKRLAALQSERARVFQWAFLTGQILWWTPFILVLFWALLRVDLLAMSEPVRSFVAINIAVGVALIPVLLWVAHGIGPKLAKSGVGRSMLDSVTGRDLAEARAIAARLAQFEAEAA
jgi:serine/threonine-protein kinase